jgi:hypothetical protein
MEERGNRSCSSCAHFNEYLTTCRLHKEKATITSPTEQCCGSMGYLDIKVKIRNNKIDKLLL